MALYPFVLVKKIEFKNDLVMMNHERIHLQQQKELLLAGFYIWYLLNYFLNILKYRNHDKAYRNIIFEKEAFNCEKDLNYLQRRKIFSFWKY